MIKDNQTLLNRIHVVVDALVIACTYIAAWFIQFEFFAPDVAGKLPLETYMSALVILIPGLLLLYHAFSLYTPKRVQGGFPVSGAALFSFVGSFFVCSI